MFLRRLFIATLATMTTAQVHAVNRVQTDTKAGRFPPGTPWRVDLADLHGKRLGSLRMVVTAVPDSSCLGEIGEGLRVDFMPSDTLSPSLPIASYGIAKFSGVTIEIDLTGGTCDGYLVMKGMLLPKGSSSGEIYTLGMGGQHNVGTYRASILSATH